MKTARLLTAAIVFAPLLAATLTAADYPAWRNDGSGAGTDCGQPMVESLDEAELIWTSEQELPFVYAYKKKREGPAGGYCNPSVADGRIFIQYNLPSPEEGPVDEAALAVAPHKTRASWRYDGENVMLAMDAKTGRTLWKQVIGDGINVWALGGLIHPHPVVADDRVFMTTTLGKVYAFAVVDGEILWESDIGPQHEVLTKIFADWKALPDAERNDPNGPTRSHKGLKNSIIKGNSQMLAAQVVDGVLAFNDSSSDGGYTAIVGLDAATGKHLWRTTGVNASKRPPIVWQHQGKGYFIGTVRGAINCLDAKTGKLVWKQSANCDGNWPTPAIKGDVLVDMGGHNGTGPTAYRLSVGGIKKLWELPGEGNGSAFASPVIYKDHVYAYVRPQKTTFGYVCIDLATGTETGRIKAGKYWSSPVIADNRLVHATSLVKADPSDFVSYGAFKDIAGGVSYGRACENVTSAIADGMLFIRGKRRLYCYDLRK